MWKSRQHFFQIMLQKAVVVWISSEYSPPSADHSDMHLLQIQDSRHREPAPCSTHQTECRLLSAHLFLQVFHQPDLHHERYPQQQNTCDTAFTFAYTTCTFSPHITHLIKTIGNAYGAQQFSVRAVMPSHRYTATLTDDVNLWAMELC